MKPKNPNARKPDYRVAAKLGDRQNNVGGAWVDQETGRIGIRFNAFIVLPTDNPELQVSLFPNTEA